MIVLKAVWLVNTKYKPNSVTCIYRKNWGLIGFYVSNLDFLIASAMNTLYLKLSITIINAE